MAIKKYTVNWPLKLDDQLYQRGEVIEQEEKDVAPLIGGVLTECIPDPPSNPDGEQEPVKSSATKPKAKAKTQG